MCDAISIVPSLVTVVGAWLIAQQYTKRLKRSDATLEFSKRYHELMADLGKITESFDEKTGNLWWTRFFDLMKFQYFFYRNGLVLNDAFVEWMAWRNYDFRRMDDLKRTAAGVSYREGWSHYKKNAIMTTTDFVEFMRQVHDAKNRREVARRVRRFPIGSRILALRKQMAILTRFVRRKSRHYTKPKKAAH